MKLSIETNMRLTSLLPETLCKNSETLNCMNDDYSKFIKKSADNVLSKSEIHISNKSELGLNQIEFIENVDEARLILKKIQNLNSHAIGFDIETNKKIEFQEHPKAGLCPYLSNIRLMQFYCGDGTAYVFDITKIKNIDIFTPVFDLCLVAHNAIFELKHLIHNGIRPKRMGCTLLQRHALTGEVFSLKDLTKLLLQVDLSKEEQTSNWGSSILTDSQIEYAAKDAYFVFKINQIQQNQLKKQPEVFQCYKRMREAQYAVAELELAGMPFNLKKHTELIHKLEKEKLELLQKLSTIMPGVDPQSSKQISGWIQSRFDQEIVKKWPLNSSSRWLRIDEGTLKLFLDLEFVPILLKFKTVSKALNSFGETLSNLVHPITKRIHARYFMAGTKTGRFSCREPNLQQIPRSSEFRSIFQASDGNCFIICDYSQIELRVCALLSQDKLMIEAYSNGEDLHQKTASLILKKPIDQITKNDRQLAKAINFGLIYGMGAKGLSSYAKNNYGVPMSLEQADNYRRVFFSQYSGLADWHKMMLSLSKGLGIVKTRGGRVRNFNLEGKQNVYTEALNSPVQGTAAEITLEALILIEKRIKGLPIKIVHLVHDEIILESPNEIASKVLDILEKSMEEAFFKMFPEAISHKEVVIGQIANLWSKD